MEPVAVSGDRLDDAFPRIEPGGGSTVGVSFDSVGAEQFAQVSSERACTRDQGVESGLAIVLDQIVESSLVMNPEVRCGVGITGGDMITPCAAARPSRAGAGSP